MSAAKTITPLALVEEAAATAIILAAESPWDAARKVRLVRSDYRPNEILEPGVNFFVLALQALGARSQYSCEGHPGGFYVLFHARYDVALRVHNCGFFHVQVEGPNVWSLRINETADRGREFDTKALRQIMRWAAAAWVKKLFPAAEKGPGF